MKNKISVRKSKKPNDSHSKDIWKQNIDEKLSTALEKLEENDEVLQKDSSNKSHDDSQKNESKSKITIDLADPAKKIRPKNQHPKSLPNIKVLSTPENIIGRETNKEYFWTHHGNELECFNGKSKLISKYYLIKVLYTKKSSVLS